ncbi:MAG TPA: hypothetical protein VHX88_00120 [Solirubrobacteraceae bacterium]|jgi:hypothetical protein|nr:hypothetical protein [Solirubrobacteraceae bacterium]
MSVTPPVHHEGGAPTGPSRDEARTFEWFDPSGRRASHYEDVTVDTQPSPERHLGREYSVFFEDGRSTWDSRSTALRHDDWFAFRDPNELWERTFYQGGASYERQIEETIAVARGDGQPARLRPEWVEYLRANLQQEAFVEQGLWLVLASAARDALSDTVAHFVVFDAGFKQRQAQAVVLYAMDLEEDHGEFPIEAARQSWLDDEPWQPARAYVERLATVADWAEVLVAANLCLEPVLGVLLRRELYERGGATNEDTVTPVIFHAAQTEWQKVNRFMAALVGFLVGHETHGAHNREVLQGWLDTWLPQARAAAEALEPLFAARPDEPDFGAARALVEGELAASLEPFGLRVDA